MRCPVGQLSLLIVTLALVSTAALGQVDRDQIRLVAPRSFATRDRVAAAAAGFVDFDRHRDIVFATERPATGLNVLEVRFGLGDRLFGASRVIPFGFGARAVLVTDIDLDGDGDILVGAVGFPLLVLRGDGTGSFGPPTAHLPNGTGRALATGDFNEDGVPDVAIAVANARLSRVSVLLGAGGGTFAPPIHLATGGGPRSLVVADLNGDSHLDIAAANAGTDDVSIFLGNGGGSFSSGSRFPAGDQPFAVAAGDVDEDGEPDLVTASRRGDAVSFLAGDGSGGFAAPLEVATAEEPRGVALADMNEDGHLDLAVSGLSVSLHLGDGSSAFTLSTEFEADHVPVLTAVDMDADSHLDLLIGPFLVHGDGLGGLLLGDRYEVGDSPETVTTGDFDGDGDLDLATADLAVNSVSILLNEGTGRYVRRESLAAGQFPRDLVAADLDEDGDLDIVVANSGASHVSYFAGRGDGSFEPDVLFSTGFDPFAVEAVDVDSNGHLDIVTASQGSDTITVRPGNGDGTFGAALESPTAFGNASWLTMAVGDFDEDGVLDVSLTTKDAGFNSIVQVMRGDGTGRFAESGRLPAAQRDPFLVTADLDGDGHLDLAFADPDGGKIVVHSGDGSGGFSNPATIPLNAKVQHLAIADLDDDGRLDIVATNSIRGPGFSVIRGRGPDGFEEPEPFGAAGIPRGVAAADLDGDGHADVAVTDVIGPSVFVFFNRTFDSILSRRGNVELLAGPPRPVLRVNESAGVGDERRVALDRFDPFEMRMRCPSLDADGTAAFALYAWTTAPRAKDVRRLPFGYGFSTMPTPLNGGAPVPRRIANNTGDPAFGVATLPSSASPSVIASLPAGIGRAGVVFVQGLIEDAKSPSGTYAVTNGIVIDFR